MVVLVYYVLVSRLLVRCIVGIVCPALEDYTTTSVAASTAMKTRVYLGVLDPGLPFLECLPDLLIIIFALEAQLIVIVIIFCI